MPPSFANPELAKFDTTYEWVPTKVFIPMFDLMKVTNKCLSEIDIPVLIMHSKKDLANSPEGAKILYSKISTPKAHKQFIWFEKTDHEIFLDCEKEKAVYTVIDYIRSRTNI